MANPIRMEPADEWNRQLIDNVHPPTWENPVPQGRYNLVVLGAGTGGLITALVASSLGARVALIERYLMGGDCLNVGCIPSKSVIRGAKIVHSAREAARFGMPGSAEDVGNFGEVMRRMREIRARISHEDSAERYRDEFGVDIYLGDARFVGEGRVEVDGRVLAYSKAVIATGARAVAPPIEGLSDAGYLDNETVFSLTERPRRLAVIGAGPIGCELAQSFRRLGSEVHILERMDQILTREDPDAAKIVREAMVREGIEMVFGCDIERVERRGEERVLHLTCPKEARREFVVDQILVGAGRAPNVEGLGLEVVGVTYDRQQGVEVDDHLRTSNQRIWAVGDVCMKWKFTHAADAAAKIVVQNALFAVGPIGRKKLSDLIMPWCTYTEPEIAHVGLYERDALEQGVEIDTYQVSMAEANRAVTDGQEEGIVKVHVKRGGDEIVGATVVSAHAGDLITQFTMAIQNGIGLGSFTNVIYPYPTQGEAIKRAAGAYTRTRLTPVVKRLFERWLSWQR
ncbi:MAG: mercuric reductase [bacterium]|nr:mercuric reductase [Deltaproteobacteria bacterium]MCP4903786.1 mercuric reductase [bacterium]